jgi:hypothetical protein
MLTHDETERVADLYASVAMYGVRQGFANAGDSSRDIGGSFWGVDNSSLIAEEEVLLQGLREQAIRDSYEVFD